MTLTGLSLYLQNRYNTTASALGWTDSTYGIIVEDVLEKLNITTEAGIAVSTLHKVGIFYLLKQALRDVATHLDSFSADGSSFNWGNLQDKIKAELIIAYSDASEFVSEDISIDLGDNRNPYQYDYWRDVYGNY